MIKPDTRFLVVADSTGRSDPEVLHTEIADASDAHSVARRAAQSEPERRFFIVEIVGYHEALLAPRYTAREQPAPLLLTPGEPSQSEDFLK